MQRKLNTFLLLLVIVAVAVTSAVRTTTVYADDGDTDPVTGETAAPAGEEENPAEEQPAVEEPVPAAEATEPPAEIVEVPTVEPVVEEAMSVPEVLEQLPEGTEVVVVNEAGEAEPLATTEAEQIIVTGDPMWCPQDATPGDAECTASFTSFSQLIAELRDPADPTRVYSGPGVIWVASDYDSTQDNSQIQLEGNSPDGSYTGNLPGLSSSNLTIRGGWSGGNNTTVDPNTPSNLDVSVSIAFWSGNVTLENLVIRNTTDGAGFGLWVDTAGDITLNNVTVQETTANLEGYGEGAVLVNGGDVSITNSTFGGYDDHGTVGEGEEVDDDSYGNFGTGLSVVSNGSVTLNNVNASGNGMHGANLDAGGTVTTTGTNVFEHNTLRGLSAVSANGASIANVRSNHNGTGLYADTLGNLTVANVNAYANNSGAILYTDLGTGAINVSASYFGSGGAGNVDGYSNNWTGLHAESGSTINLNNVRASGNQNNGAYLVAEGDILVQNSFFNGNVLTCSCVDPGLYAKSQGGNITVSNTVANDNLCGAGLVVKTTGTGTIAVNGGEFDRNGSANPNGDNGVVAHSAEGAITFTGGEYNANTSFGIQAGSASGNITLDNVIASFNGVKGAYLNTGGTGNIFIGNNSMFEENGSYGIYASASEGNIQLSTVTVLGNNVTDYGAVLQAVGNVNVNSSTFNLNTAVGLTAISGTQVGLASVTADQNGGNGVEVYSITTAGPICPDDTPVSILVRVGGGAYTNNDGYGLVVKPGPEGTLSFGAPTTFFGNTLGDYLLDLSQAYKDCTQPPKDPCEEGPCEGTEPKVVEVPSTGGPVVEQDCDQYSGTILKLPNGTWTMVGCPFEGSSYLEEVQLEDLPGPLGISFPFISAIALDLTDAFGETTLNEDGTITINFIIPEDSEASRYSILFWDPMLKDGQGGWVELPPYEYGTSFQLHPDNPVDTRTIVSGVQQIGNLVTVTVDFSGVFVLVAQ